jgi:hypothetical protein
VAVGGNQGRGVLSFGWWLHGDSENLVNQLNQLNQLRISVELTTVYNWFNLRLQLNQLNQLKTATGSTGSDHPGG